MSKLASAMRAEISRLAQREVRVSVTKLERQLRELIRDVRRQAAQVQRLEKAPRVGARVDSTGGSGVSRGQDYGVAKLTPKSIRTRRKRLGLSQAEMARLVGVTPVAVYLWESGRTTPRGRTRAGLLELRNVGSREVRARLEAADAGTGTLPERRRQGPRKKKATRRKAGGGGAAAPRRGRRSA